MGASSGVKDPYLFELIAPLALSLASVFGPVGIGAPEIMGIFRSVDRGSLL